MQSIHSKLLLVSTRNKLRFVKFLYFLIRPFVRQKDLVINRNGLSWNVDLKEAIDLNIFLTGRYEPELSIKMEEIIKEGDVVLDIGANVGGHALPLTKMVGSEGRVYAVEPTDFAFDKLQKNIEMNPEIRSRISPIKTFLTDTSKNNIPKSVSASWSIEGGMSDEKRNQLDMGFAKEITDATVLTLDELVDSLNLEKLNAIKLDVDGHEVEILKGAANTVEKFSPVFFIEFAPIHYEALKTTFHEQVELLVDYGYSFEDVLGKKLPSDPQEIMNSIPRGTLVNVVARRLGQSEIRRRKNAERLETLKEKLKSYMAGQQQSWSYLKVIRPGYASKKLYAIYMTETYHYTFHNSRNQAVIPARRDEMDINYMKFCLHHAEEEAGHEMMAFNDIRKLGFNLRKDNLPEPLPATQELIRYIYETAEKGNPLARLGYSFWAERVYSYIAPLLQLMKVVGIGGKSMTFFNEHSDIDAKHAEEVDEAIIRFARTEEDWAAIEECMIGTLDRTIKMTHEVLGEYDKLRDKTPTRYDHILGVSE